ncbi:ABC transporter ATP-binding protein [Amycolatopsis rubida]|uniref:Multiple sugar transport system ATP-binding protein n=1 Tax=Amycolatopsis rubida TaxID=112413 RepID=A0A1I5SHA2_9PSEU|nr:ABC transporter ATP-binding protein [Amycolatopsis rubida]SFP70098.1 multiple sugar transport system ATP-binding protein [Amycolatopsis rubida]
MGQIQLEGLTRRFGSVTAVDQVHLEIADGDFVALLGPSGCGKTTLLRMIAGLLPPSSGRIAVEGRDVTDLAPKRRDLAMVFQSYALYPHLTVAGNIGFPLRVRRRPRAEIRERVEKAAAQLDLSPLLRRRPKELSGGQRQRVALGRALVREPAAFLMDEPLSNLDAKLRTATRAELAALHRRLGSTFVYVTHDQVEAMTMATRIALLDGGRLEQVGTPAEVYDEPASVFVAGFLGSPPMNLVPATARTADGRVRVHAEAVDVPLWTGSTPEQEVILGIRPEHLSFAPLTEEPGARPLLRGTVSALENLGSEEVALCAVGDATVAVRGPRPLGVVPGEAVALTALPERIHLFDGPSGRRLVWRPETVLATV